MNLLGSGNLLAILHELSSIIDRNKGRVNFLVHLLKAPQITFTVFEDIAPTFVVPAQSGVTFPNASGKVVSFKEKW